MILYLDSSALSKRYVAEAGSADVERLIGEAELVATSVITRAEISAALARARRQHLLEADTAAQVRALFTSHWDSLIRLSLIESTVERADALAWELDLRGYDAVHLATAAQWADSMAEAPLLATFDRELWKGAEAVGLQAWPADLD
jgi:predicted nucleic acid-binding protein